MPNKYYCIGITLLFFGLVFLVVGIFGVHEMQYWGKNGVKVQGIVTDKYIQEKCQSGTGGKWSCSDYYYLVYNYTSKQGKSYKGKDDVSQSLWKSHHKGASLTLFYSTIEASKSTVAFAEDTETKKRLFLIVLIVGILFFIIGSIFIYRAYQQKPLN